MSTERNSELFIGVILNNEEVKYYIENNTEQLPESKKVLIKTPGMFSMIAESLAEELGYQNSNLYGWEGEKHIIGYKYDSFQNAIEFQKEISEKTEKLSNTFKQEVKIIDNISEF